MEFATLIDKYGLPLATAAFFIWQYFKLNKEHKDDIKNIATESTAALNRAADAIEKNNQILERRDAARTGGS